MNFIFKEEETPAQSEENEKKNIIYQKLSYQQFLFFLIFIMLLQPKRQSFKVMGTNHSYYKLHVPYSF